MLQLRMYSFIYDNCFPPGKIRTFHDWKSKWEAMMEMNGLAVYQAPTCYLRGGMCR